MKRSYLSLLALPLFLLGAGCPSGSGNGAPADPTAVSSAFYVGTLALQTAEKNHPIPSLEKAYKLAPSEPAIAANLALAHLRAAPPDFAKAGELLAEAKKGAPDNSEIAAIEGLLLTKQGKYAEAIAAYQRTAEKSPGNIRLLYQIVELSKQQGGPGSEAAQQKALEALLAVSPNNLPAQFLLAQSLARQGDAPGVARLLALLDARKSRWSLKAQERFATLKTKSIRQLALELVMLANVLKPERDFAQGKFDLTNFETAEGDPLQRFVTLANPPATPAKPDTTLLFSAPSSASGTLALALQAENKPTVQALPAGAMQAVVFDFDTMRGGFEGEVGIERIGARHPNDQSRDFRQELAAAGPGGLKLYENGKQLSVKLPIGACTGVWAADIETDGDLDLIVSPASGKPYVLQNNGDRTFTQTPPKFDAVACPIQSFAWADFDGDGDTDPAFVDAKGKLVRYLNERSGAFTLEKSSTQDGLVALAVAETSGDTLLDLVALNKSGEVLGIADGKPSTLLQTKRTDGVALFWEDFDNNGATDLLLAGKDESELWLSETPGKFVSAPLKVPFQVTSVADLTGDGLLDLVGLAKGKPVQATASGKAGYGYLTLSLKAKQPTNPADKINNLCVGGAFEARAGLLYQKVPVTGPQMHLGLGTYKTPDVIRMFWPSGRAQSVFADDPELKAGAPLVADQALGGSCPFLFTWNGKEFVFVTDCIWRSPLGLKINAQDTAGATQTEDWVKVRGDQLAPKNGFYELSITAELNETHYFDHLGLLTVDHPEGTEIFVDERFRPTEPPLLQVIPTGPTQPFAQVRGFKGQDASEIVAERDTRYLDDFGRGKYQGIAGDHWVELELPARAPQGKPLYLIAHGWLHPTNTSLNVAMSQDKTQGPPQGLSLWTPDPKSKTGWTKKRDALGFPAGKLKTVVLRLDDLFAPRGQATPRRVRLCTNLEVFWDQLQWAEARPDSVLKINRLSAREALLRYRGFSRVEAVDHSSPELPVSYTQLLGLTPRWRDLTGYVTRFGDVKPLLSRVDDRYAILNAGDELLFRFPEKPAPTAGWKRDFVVISDGWEKDGNINTTFGKTVGPYPLHALKDYPNFYEQLEDDPAYKKHPEDFVTYHTRWISTDSFERAYLPPR